MQRRSLSTKTIIMSTVVIFLISLFTIVIYNMVAIPKKEVIYGELIWPDLSFEEFVQKSHCIVYGRVVRFEKVIAKESKVNEAVTSRQVYTPVIIEVYKWIKGDEPSDTVTYYQVGGETDTHIYVDRETNPLVKSEFVLLFLNEKGGRIMPESVMRIKNGNVIVPPKMLPQKTTDNTEGNINVDEYIKMIEESLCIFASRVFK